MSGSRSDVKRFLVRDRLAVGLILLGGLALRLFRLGAESLWYDETVSVYLAGSPLPELIRHTAGDIHPPGYYLLLRAWLLLTGFGDGRADPQTLGLEFVAGFLSLFFGVLLIALVYAVARRVAGQAVGLAAAGFVAFSPFNVWYSQEVRMYTVGAALGLLAFRGLLDLVEGRKPRRAAAGYALAAALGMYTLYYFAFLLLALNAWALVALLRQRRALRPLLLANLAAVVLYAPWIPVAFRQATEPPVPPWRTTPDVVAALRESWTALSLGQSAPVWVWPALLLTAALYVLGLIAIARQPRGPQRAWGLAAATLGPLLLILLISLLTPLYHVRYLFTYSPAFYIGLGAGVVSLTKPDRFRPSTKLRQPVRFGVAILACIVWLAAAGVTLRAFWFDPAYRADDHRAAVRQLEAQWRPGDAVLVNAGWAYTVFSTYWTGDIATRTRITEPLPGPSDTGLALVTTGHTDGDPGLGWGDPRSDFFAMPAEVVKQQVPELLERFRRVWHYRIYDTVNDPDGLIRALLPRYGLLTDERTYAGEAFTRVESYVPRGGVAWQEELPGATFEGGLSLRFEPVVATVAAGEAAHSALTWRSGAPLTRTLATSLRLLDAAGELVYQPPDVRPLGPLLPSTQWPAGVALPQTLAIAAPEGAPPGEYAVVLVVYDAQTGLPLPPAPLNGAQAHEPGLRLGTLTIAPPAVAPAPRPALADFGPVALVEATTPATVIAAGASVPVELLWQSRAPAPDLVVVVQLLGEDGSLAANLEEPPAGGRHPAPQWTEGELVRDEHTLTVPLDKAPGTYRLIVGLYDAADGERLTARAGLLGRSDHYEVGAIDVR